MRIYWDTCLVIYEVERAAPFADRLRAARDERPSAEVCTSDLVRMECMVVPLRRHDELSMNAWAAVGGLRAP